MFSCIGRGAEEIHVYGDAARQRCRQRNVEGVHPKCESLSTYKQCRGRRYEKCLSRQLRVNHRNLCGHAILPPFSLTLKTTGIGREGSFL